MRVTVLYGGPSAEREVSLVSGKAVIDGLRSMGHEVFGSDGGLWVALLSPDAVARTEAILRSWQIVLPAWSTLQ